MQADKPIIVLDIDGVIFSTPEDSVSLSNKLHGTSYVVGDIFDYNADHDKAKFTIQGVDQFYYLQERAELNRPVLFSREAIRDLSKVATIIALTSRNYDHFYDATVQAIQRYFEGTISEIYFTTAPGHKTNDSQREKGEIVNELGGVLLIDDSVRHCLSCKRYGIPAILFGHDYNQRGHEYSPELTAFDWLHAKDLALTILSKIIHS